MRKSERNFGDGPVMTAFEAFEDEYELKLLTVKLQCPKCGHVWGIKIDDYNTSLDIPEKKFTCECCKK